VLWVVGIWNVHSDFGFGCAQESWNSMKISVRNGHIIGRKILIRRIERAPGMRVKPALYRPSWNDHVADGGVMSVSYPSVLLG
jgi:hypothetical protein